MTKKEGGGGKGKADSQTGVTAAAQLVLLCSFSINHFLLNERRLFEKIPVDKLLTLTQRNTEEYFCCGGESHPR